MKTIVSNSGFGWDNTLKMATTTGGVWADLPKDLRRWDGRSFPFYDDLHEIYDGKLAGGKNCRRSLEKGCKAENKTAEEDCAQISTPSPTIDGMHSSYFDLELDGTDLNNKNGFNLDINASQYRAFAEERAAREAQWCGQTHVDIPVSEMEESQTRKFSDTACDNTDIPVREERAKKKPKRNDNAMNDLLALRKEELEAFKELTTQQVELKKKQIEQANPSNDPYSMSKCMSNLNSLSLSLTERLKAINFLKGDKEAREIFICCEEQSLADAYIKGSIAD